MVRSPNMKQRFSVTLLQLRHFGFPNMITNLYLLIPARILCMTVQDGWFQSNKAHGTHTTGQELGFSAM